MRIYLAADYARKEEMKGCRTVLEGFGHTVVSEWLDSPVPVGYGLGGLPITVEDEATCRSKAFKNVDDLSSADLLILFTTGNLSRGGRHTELGIAIAWQKSIVIIGPREHSFQCYPNIQHYLTWERFVIEFTRGYFE